MTIKKYSLHTGKRIVVIALRTAIIFAISLLALFFLGRNISSTTENIVAARNEFIALTAQYSALNQAEHDYEMLREVPGKIEALTPSVDTVLAVEDFLTGAAAKTNVLLSISLASFPTQNTIETLEELGIALRIEGGEQELISFLKMIETAPYLISIQNLSTTFGDTGVTLTTQATGIIYLKKQSE